MLILINISVSLIFKFGLVQDFKYDYPDVDEYFRYYCTFQDKNTSIVNILAGMEKYYFGWLLVFGSNYRQV